LQNLAPFEIEAVHPDVFLSSLIEANTETRSLGGGNVNGKFEKSIKPLSEFF